VAAANVDESHDAKIPEAVMTEIRSLAHVKQAWLVRV
jgi:hypothetical protein